MTSLPSPSTPAPTGEPLTIGVTCWPTYGGSGIVATEIGLRLAARGHRVHFISYDVPIRLDTLAPGVFFHEVERSDYPLFEQGNYPLALASKMVEVSRWERLDVLHVHYAIPHAAAAFLAARILESEGLRPPALVTTLHGTDITLVGGDPSFLPTTRFSILAGDAVTAPSEFLREATYARLGLDRATPIDVIPNFVDTEHFHPTPEPGLEALAGLLPRGATPPSLEAGIRPRVLVHNSNFRPVKRVDLVVRAFAEVHRRHPETLLLLVGDGPERSHAEALVRELGLSKGALFLGKQRGVAEVLRAADLFLLPSETESFGLAALEAQASGVPVIASRVGGLPEVVDDGVTGLLVPTGDAAAMADAACDLLDDPTRHRAMSAAARARAVAHFRPDPAVAAYEALYRRVLATSSSRRAPWSPRP